MEHVQSEATKAMKLVKQKGNWICTDPVRGKKRLILKKEKVGT